MGDKGATLDGLKVSHDNLDGKITDLKSDLSQQLFYENSAFDRIFEDWYTTQLSTIYMTAGTGTSRCRTRRAHARRGCARGTRKGRAPRRRSR